MKFNNNNRILYTNDGKNLYQWDTKTGKQYN